MCLAMLCKDGRAVADMNCMLFMLSVVVRAAEVYDGAKYGMQGSVAWPGLEPISKFCRSRGPCVLHGGTATTAVSFEACLEVWHSLS